MILVLRSYSILYKIVALQFTITVSIMKQNSHCVDFKCSLIILDVADLDKMLCNHYGNKENVE